jgi:L-methionine (R)-S-oxide reductase
MREPNDERVDYALCAKQVAALLEGEPGWLPALANTSALLFEAIPRVSWVGFYLADGDGLVLGPFQGKPACIRIPSGKGVCGTAMAQDRVQVVRDVHEFPGHIACDSASNSEIVLPVHSGGKVAAVLDIDSTDLGRFGEEDASGLAEVVRALEAAVDFGSRY